MTAFSDRLKHCRLNRCLTQRQTAMAIGTSEQNYQRYERGSQQPTLSVLILLADFFGVSVDYLAGKSRLSFIMTESEINGVKVYGLKCENAEHLKVECEDISTDPDFLLNLVDKLNQNDVKLDHIMDIIQDELQSH